MNAPPDLPPESTPRYAGFVVRNRWLILLVTLVLVALGSWRTSKLRLKTDMVELLPEKHPAVVVMREMAKRISSISNVVVVVQSPSPDANKKYVDDLVPKLRALNSPDIADVEPG